jgi:hypothetical protein
MPCDDIGCDCAGDCEGAAYASPPARAVTNNMIGIWMREFSSIMDRRRMNRALVHSTIDNSELLRGGYVVMEEMFGRGFFRTDAEARDVGGMVNISFPYDADRNVHLCLDYSTQNNLWRIYTEARSRTVDGTCRPISTMHTRSVYEDAVRVVLSSLAEAVVVDNIARPPLRRRAVSPSEATDPISIMDMKGE